MGSAMTYVERTSPADRLEVLGRAGFTVSICCGPSGLHACRWSVLVMNAHGEECEVPFAAKSFAHAIEIAELEIVKRGWR